MKVPKVSRARTCVCVCVWVVVVVVVVVVGAYHSTLGKASGTRRFLPVHGRRAEWEHVDVIRSKSAVRRTANTAAMCAPPLPPQRHCLSLPLCPRPLPPPPLHTRASCSCRRRRLRRVMAGGGTTMRHSGPFVRVCTREARARRRCRLKRVAWRKRAATRAPACSSGGGGSGSQRAAARTRLRRASRWATR